MEILNYIELYRDEIVIEINIREKEVERLQIEANTYRRVRDELNTLLANFEGNKAGEDVKGIEIPIEEGNTK